MIQFEIMGLPRSTNGGHGHWRADWARKKEWKDKVGSALWGQIPKKPFPIAKAIFTRCSSSEPDNDNLAISFKPIADALKVFGVITDDKPSCFKVEYRWEKTKPKAGRIRVTVEEIK